MSSHLLRIATMVTPVHDYISTITVGRIRYTHYPLRNIDRQETEALLRHPVMRNTIILRVSAHARQESPTVYYVLSFIPPQQRDPIHVLLTRAFHEEHHARILTTLPYPMEEYVLLLLPHHPAYAQTRTERVVLPPAPLLQEPGASSS